MLDFSEILGFGFSLLHKLTITSELEGEAIPCAPRLDPPRSPGHLIMMKTYVIRFSLDMFTRGSLLILQNIKNRKKYSVPIYH